jgi:hypothetical protein
MEAELAVAGRPAAAAGDHVASGQERAASVAEQGDTLDQSLQAVQLELELHSKNLISLGFEESIQMALKDIGGGEMLFPQAVQELSRESADREQCKAKSPLSSA